MIKYFMRSWLEQIVLILILIVCIITFVFSIKDILFEITSIGFADILSIVLSLMVGLSCMLMFIPYIKFHDNKLVIFYGFKEIIISINDIENLRYIQLPLRGLYGNLELKNKKKFPLLIASKKCYKYLILVLEKENKIKGVQGYYS